MKKFFHISLKNDLEGIWNPRLPEKSSNNKKGLTEPDIPRISVSTSIRDCFRAIYPNVAKFFEEEKLPYLIFSIYSPVITPNTKMIHWEELRDKLYVHDAHVTHESWILGSVKMELIGTIKIFNTDTSGNDLLYSPFNNPKINKVYHSPREICFEIISNKKNIEYRDV